MVASDTVHDPEISSQTDFELEAERMDERLIESSESELSSDEDTRDMLASKRYVCCKNIISLSLQQHF